MGWDAFATRDGELIKVDWARDQIVDETLRIAFESAAESVKEKAEWVDGLLPLGGLDLSGCGEAINAMSDLEAWSDGATAEEIRELVFSDSWEYAVRPHHITLYEWWSARKFLEVCARYGLGVRFNW